MNFPANILDYSYVRLERSTGTCECHFNGIFQWFSLPLFVINSTLIWKDLCRNACFTVIPKYSLHIRWRYLLIEMHTRLRLIIHVSHHNYFRAIHIMQLSKSVRIHAGKYLWNNLWSCAGCLRFTEQVSNLGFPDYG